MPTLINKINRAHWNSLLKADYSILAQAHQYLTNEDDGIVGKLSNCSGTAIQKNTCFRDVMASRIKKAFECNYNSSDSVKCFPPRSEIKFLNGESASSSGYVAVSYSSSLVIENGSAMIFWLDSPTCEQQSQRWKDVCGWVNVDVNGGKGPNVIGEDIYIFYIHKAFVRPYPLCSSKPCDKNSPDSDSAKGFDCAGYYLTK